MSRLLLAIAIVLLVPATVMAGGRKPPPVTVTFHLQANPGEGEKLVFPFTTAGKEVFYRRSPAFSERDIIAFQSFPADDKNSYGLILQLNSVAKGRLASLSGANSGKFLLAMVNGSVRDAVLIDRSVEDGLLIIWQRIGLAEVRAADGLMPRIGETVKEWKTRMKNK